MTIRRAILDLVELIVAFGIIIALCAVSAPPGA